MPRIRDYPEAGSLEPTDAFVIDRQGIGTMYVEGDVFGQGFGSSYLFSWSNTGPALTNAEEMGAHVFALSCTAPDDLAGTVFYVETLPTSTVTAEVFHVTANRSSTSLGTMTINPDGSYSFQTSAVTFGVGDSISFVGPTPADPTFANMRMTGVAALG